MSDKKTLDVTAPDTGNQDADQRSGAHRAVVLLGPGRSGTSLCAKILQRLGMRMADTLQRANEMNPEGYFEDSELLDVNKQLIDLLSPAAPYVPPLLSQLPDSAKPLIARIRTHLTAHVLEQGGVWGFKDPRSTLLLPIYRRVFQNLGIVPIYIFCAREGSAVVESLLQATQLSRITAEQVYITRSLTGLRDCAANCHVLHYERLIKDPVRQIDALANHVWPDGNPPNMLSDKEKHAQVNAALNRSALKAQPLVSPVARQLDTLIAGMEGHDFDRDNVMAQLRDLGAVHDGYLSWVELMAKRETGRPLPKPSEKPSRVKDEALAGLGQSLTALLADNARMRKAVNAAETRAAGIATELNDLRVGQRAARTDSTSDHNIRLRDANAALARQLADTQAEVVQLRDQAVLASAQRRPAPDPGREKPPTKKTAPPAKATKRDDPAIARLQREQSELRAKLDQTTKARNEARTNNATLRKQLAASRAALTEAQAAHQHIQAEFVSMENSVRHRAGTAMVEAVTHPGWRTITLPWRLIQIGRKRSKPELPKPGDNGGDPQ